LDWLSHLVHAAAWIGALILLFAIIGFVATLRWIFSLFSRGEQAVEGAAHRMGDSLRKP